MFLNGFPGPRGRPDPEIRRFPAGPKNHVLRTQLYTGVLHRARETQSPVSVRPAGQGSVDGDSMFSQFTGRLAIPTNPFISLSGACESSKGLSGYIYIYIIL